MSINMSTTTTPSNDCEVCCVTPSSSATLSRLQRKPSLPTMKAHGVKAPSLQPKTLEPQRCSGATMHLESLANVQRIEISGTRVRDGVTYYVLDVFLHHFNTRLPATLTYLRQACSSPPYQPNSEMVSASSKPDYQIERRFSEFCGLRHFVYDVACLNPQFRCEYCQAFIEYVRFRPQQPDALAKVFSTSANKRKRMLERFLTNFVHMAQWRHLQNRKCESHDAIPLFIDQFIREDECKSLSSSSPSP